VRHVVDSPRSPLDRAELEAELPKESRMSTLTEVPFRIDGVILVGQGETEGRFTGGPVKVVSKETAMENRFDELAKALAGGVSRREVRRRLVFWAAGGTVAALGLATKAEAAVGETRRIGECHRLCSNCTAGKTPIRECVDACRWCLKESGTLFTLAACDEVGLGWGCGF
jgi:hypothetical protein